MNKLNLKKYFPGEAPHLVVVAVEGDGDALEGGAVAREVRLLRKLHNLRGKNLFLRTSLENEASRKIIFLYSNFLGTRHNFHLYRDTRKNGCTLRKLNKRQKQFPEQDFSSESLLKRGSRVSTRPLFTRRRIRLMALSSLSAGELGGAR